MGTFLFGKWSHKYVRKMIEMSKSELKSCFDSDTVDTDFVVTSVLRNEWESTQTMMPAKRGAFLGTKLWAYEYMEFSVLRSMEGKWEGLMYRPSCVGRTILRKFP